MLIETQNEDGSLTGFTDSYVRVNTYFGEPNKLYVITVKSITEDKNGELSLLSDN